MCPICIIVGFVSFAVGVVVGFLACHCCCHDDHCDNGGNDDNVGVK